MQHYSKVRDIDPPELAVGRELAEEDLTAIYGGAAGSSTETASVPGYAPGLSNLGSTFGSLGSALGNQFNGLLGGGLAASPTASSNTTPPLSVNGYPILEGLF